MVAIGNAMGEAAPMKIPSPNPPAPSVTASGWHLPVMVAATVLFALRVAAQVVQRWAPVAWLPPAGAFQGSGLPYPLLLTAQLAILALMLRAGGRLAAGVLVPRVVLGRRLCACGVLYLTLSLARLAVGLAAPEAAAWFRAWIPGLFHLVLAGFVLTLGHFHCSRRIPS